MQSMPKISEPAPKANVRCSCGHVIFDGRVIKSRVVMVDDHGAQAKCRCKRWVSVPVAFRE